MSKSGRLSAKEQEFIVAHASAVPPAEIAKRLGRNERLVRKFMASRGLEGAIHAHQSRVAVREELKASERWRRLSQEFEVEELKFFEEEYLKLMSQFRGDVLPSEEIQIFDAVKFDILKSRNMVARKRARDDISRLERMQDDFLAQFGGDPTLMDDAQRAFALNLDTQLTKARTEEQTRTVEYVKFQERQDALMKSLKSTRDQRIREVQTGKETVFGLLKMLQRDEVRRAEGRQMELMKMAGKREYERLGQLTEYEDGGVDRPILSPDTVDLGEEKE